MARELTVTARPLPSRLEGLDRAEIVRNSQWLGKLDMADVLRLTSSYTVARMLERDDFATRYREGRPISVVEFLYPLLQGLDSVEVRADVELGGTDQLFNLIMGRHLQEREGQEPQVVLTTPLLVGLDGAQKIDPLLERASAFGWLALARGVGCSWPALR